MSNITSTLAKRLRFRSVPLSKTLTQPAIYPKPIHSDTLKQRTADWDPTVKFEDLDIKSPVKGNNDEDQEIAYMATYSAIDPCSTHPFLLSSTLPLSVSDLASSPLSVSTSGAKSRTQRNSSMTNPNLHPPSTTSSLHHATEVQQSVPIPTLDKFMPWPYSLPKAMQPKVGTTYDLMYGEGGSEGGVGKVKLGIVQKVLYGVPESEKKEVENEEGGRDAW